MRDIDLVIVGGGPAGLTAGLYAARSNINAILLEKGPPGGELLNTNAIEDWPGDEHVSGHELAMRMEKHALKFGLKMENATVTGISKLKDPHERGTYDKLIELEEGEPIRAKAVIVAAGGEPLKLGVPGELEYAGRGVSYCAICDGAFFRGHRLAVIGGGDSAFQEALFLTRFAEKLYLVHRRDAYRAQPVLQEELKANPKVELITNATVEAIVGGKGGAVDHLDLQVEGKAQRLDVTGVFVFIGFRPRSGLFKSHIDHDPQDYVVTDANMLTSWDGVFAVGDLRAQLAKQITTAAGDATTATIAAGRYLEERARQDRLDRDKTGAEARPGVLAAQASH